MNILIAPALGVLGLIAAFVVFSLVMRYSDGTDQVKKIGDEIHKGAMKFMKTEYTYLLIFVAVLVVLSCNISHDPISNCGCSWRCLFILSWIHWNVCSNKSKC